MAENITQKQLEAELKLLEAKKKSLDVAEQLSAAQQKELKGIEKSIERGEKRLHQLKLAVDVRKLEAKEFDSFAKKFRQMSGDVQQQLKGTSSSAAVYLSLGRNISKDKAIQLKYADSTNKREQELLAKAEERESIFTDISTELASQAKATQKAEDNLRGISDIEREIRDIKESTGMYSAIEKKRLIEGIQQTEQLRLKEERINQIKEEQKDLYDALPESVKGAVGFAKKLGVALKNGALPLVLISALALATLSSFTKLDTAAKEFRDTTGLTNSQMVGIKSDANAIVGEFGYLGVEAKNVFDTISALKSEFSDIADFSQETTAALTVLNANFGVSADNAAKVQGILEQVSGLSSETAASVQLQVVNMAKLAGVAPAKVMADIAESAEIASTLFRGDTVALAKNAIEARRLGTNLKSVAATAEKLLDFESGIEEELTAATFVGGQFNLSRARALAFEGKIVEAQKETLSQIQRSGDFRKQDFFTQQQLAKAAGMTVEEVNKQLNAQDKLNSLTSEQRKLAEDAINAGLDISDINKEDLANQVKTFSLQQEQQATLDKISNLFTGIASTVGSSLVPLLEGMGAVLTPIFSVVSGIFNALNAIPGVLPGIIAGFSALYLLTKKAAIQARIKAISEIFAGNAKFGPIGLIAAAAGIGTLLSFLSKPVAEPAGDILSPAGGRTQVSTKEGGLFQLSPNDDLIAAPNAAAALTNRGTNEGGGTSNLSMLAAPMQAMVNEVKALRADLSAGKIAVYMDAQKVTNGVARRVDETTRNSYNLGTV